MTLHSPVRFNAVLDSNAYIDIVSIHDLLRAEPAKREMRVVRLRDAAVLAICLHEVGATTYSLREGADILADKVPPESGGLEEEHIKAFGYFVYPHVLSKWSAVHPKDRAPRGNAADGHLIEVAKEHDIPFITSDGPATKRAQKLGVRVATPREYWAPLVDVEVVSRRFLARYRSLARSYAASSNQPRAWAALLDRLYDQYRRLLLGR